MNFFEKKFRTKIKYEDMLIRHATKQDVYAISEMERVCFSVSEAASKERFEQRIQTFPDHFWIMEINGDMVAVINGCTTDSEHLTDEMYENVALHDENGKNQMLFGVLTEPDFQHKGYGSILMQYVILDCKIQKKAAIILTCKDKYISYYEKFGFRVVGKSDSTHGGVEWNEMRLDLSKSK